MGATRIIKLKIAKWGLEYLLSNEMETVVKDKYGKYAQKSHILSLIDKIERELGYV